MSAKAMGRRLFSRAAIGVPTALKFGGQHAPPPRGVAACGLPAMPSVQDVAKAELRNNIWKAIRIKGREESDQQDTVYAKRMMMGGLDPDLSVLNSMSLARRVQIQVDRNAQAQDRQRGFRAWIIRSMGGNPEDFE